VYMAREVLRVTTSLRFRSPSLFSKSVALQKPLLSCCNIAEVSTNKANSVGFRTVFAGLRQTRPRAVFDGECPEDDVQR
jgi:hypothetical protein